MGEYDLTIEKDVVQLMESSSSKEVWSSNCDSVKNANNGGISSILVQGYHTLGSCTNNCCKVGW